MCSALYRNFTNPVRISLRHDFWMNCIPSHLVWKIPVCRSTRSEEEHAERRGAVPLLPLKSRGKGPKGLLMLCTNRSFSHFLPTFVLLSGSTSFYPQELITCHEMQQLLSIRLLKVTHGWQFCRYFDVIICAKALLQTSSPCPTVAPTPPEKHRISYTALTFFAIHKWTSRSQLHSFFYRNR